MKAIHFLHSIGVSPTRVAKQFAYVGKQFLTMSADKTLLINGIRSVDLSTDIPVILNDKQVDLILQ